MNKKQKGVKKQMKMNVHILESTPEWTLLLTYEYGVMVWVPTNEILNLGVDSFGFKISSIKESLKELEFTEKGFNMLRKAIKEKIVPLILGD